MGTDALPRPSFGLALVLIAPLVIAAAPAPKAKSSAVAAGAACMAGDPNLAIEGCTALIEAGGSSIAEQTAIYVNRGTAFARVGMFRLAMADLDRAVTLSPGVEMPYLARGTAAAQAGRFDQAVNDLTQAIAIKPDLAAAFRTRGRVYSKKGDYARAASDYTVAIALEPHSAVGYNGRAWARHLAGQDKLGLPDANKAVDLAPGDGEALETRAATYAALSEPAHDDFVRRAVAALDDRTTRFAVDAERTVLDALGGGCQVPIGAHCRPVLEGDQVLAWRLHAQVVAPDGEQVVAVNIDAPAGTSALSLGLQAADGLKQRGALELLGEAAAAR